MADISLTASMRSNLLSLQQTQSLMDMTQERLSTGKKVNSAIDNPSSYYTAQSLTNRASDLSSLLDSMGQAIQTIQAADEGIETITEFAQQAKAIANSARDEAAVKAIGSLEIGASSAAKDDGITVRVTDADGNVTEKELKLTAAATNTADDKTVVADAVVALMTGTDGVKEGIKTATVAEDGSVTIEAKAGYKVEITGGIGGLDGKIDSDKAMEPKAGVVSGARQKYASQFDSILKQIDQVAQDAGYKGVNLLQSNDLKVIFNEDRSSYLDIKGQDASSAGLKISKSANDWTTDADIETAITQVEKAIDTLRAMSNEFGNNYSIVQSRETFTENMINVLEEGADKLTLADMNEESANMLALQTRQQLAINSLSLASQASQSVLSLF